MKSEVLTEMNIKIVVFLDVDSVWSGRELRTFRSKLMLSSFSPGKMEAAGFSRGYLPNYTASHPKRP
jgi:hypothetical protein